MFGVGRSSARQGDFRFWGFGVARRVGGLSYLLSFRVSIGFRIVISLIFRGSGA